MSFLVNTQHNHHPSDKAVTTSGTPDSTSTTSVRARSPVTIRTRLRDTPSASASALTVAAFALPLTARAVTRTMRTGGSESPYLPPTLVAGAPGDTRTTMRIDLLPILRERGACMARGMGAAGGASELSGGEAVGSYRTRSTIVPVLRAQAPHQRTQQPPLGASEYHLDRHHPQTRPMSYSREAGFTPEPPAVLLA